MNSQVVVELSIAVILFGNEETRAKLAVAIRHAANLMHQVRGIIKLGSQIIWELLVSIHLAVCCSPRRTELTADHDLANDNSLNALRRPCSRFETQGLGLDKLNTKLDSILFNELVNLRSRTNVALSKSLLGPVL